MRAIRIILLLVTGAVALSIAAWADDVIGVRVSVKVIRHVDGRLPSGVNLARLSAIINGDLNQPPLGWWRGYRFELVDPITPIGGGDPNGPSRWFGVNFLEESGIRSFLQAASGTQRAAYAWNAGAINIYLNDATGDGIAGLFAAASDLPSPAAAIVLGGRLAENQGVYLHEIGHLFGLPHTQGRQCGACQAGGTGVCNTAPGEDDFADTLPDLACWNADDIARFSFGTDVGSLPPVQREQVLDVFENVMSYHSSAVRSRLTELQLDRWADIASGHLPSSPPREQLTDGRTLFVEADPATSGQGSSREPFRDPAQAVAAANPQGTDILLFRPGLYPEARIFDRAVTLRVARPGPAVLGGVEPRQPTFVLAWTGANGAVRTVESNDLENFLNLRSHTTGARITAGPTVAHDQGMVWMLMWVKGPELQYKVGFGGLGSGSPGILWEQNPTTGALGVQPAGSPALAFGNRRWVAVFQRQGGQLTVARSRLDSAASWETPRDVEVPGPRSLVSSDAPALAFGHVGGTERFVLVFTSGANQTQALVTTSPDGHDWSLPREIGSTNKEPALAIHDGAVFVTLARTVSPLSNHVFDVLRSEDAVNWHKVAEITRTAVSGTGPGLAIGVTVGGACRVLLIEQLGGALGGVTWRIAGRHGRPHERRIPYGRCPFAAGVAFTEDVDVLVGGNTIGVANSAARTALAFGRAP